MRKWSKWILVSTGSIVFLYTIILLVIGASWRTYESIDGSFSVEIPRSWVIGAEEVDDVTFIGDSLFVGIRYKAGAAGFDGTTEENIGRVVFLSNSWTFLDTWSEFRVLDKGEWEGVNHGYYCEHLLFDRKNESHVIIHNTYLVFRANVINVHYAKVDHTEMTREDYTTIERLLDSVKVHE